MEDAINPSYYKFPGGVQAIDITRHLNGNGAQASEYIIRSTRTDGVIKGDPIENLDKAIWFCEDEKKRILMMREEASNGNH